MPKWSTCRWSCSERLEPIDAPLPSSSCANLHIKSKSKAKSGQTAIIDILHPPAPSSLTNLSRRKGKRGGKSLRVQSHIRLPSRCTSLDFNFRDQRGFVILFRTARVTRTFTALSGPKRGGGGGAGGRAGRAVVPVCLLHTK